MSVPGGCPVAHVLRDPFRSAAALLLLSLATMGCAAGAAEDRGAQAAATWHVPPPGFTADTFSREGLVRGASATEAGCRALADGLWVGAGGGRRECLRYALAGAERGSAPAGAGSYHRTAVPGLQVAQACAAGGPAPALRGTLPSGDAEIAPTLAGPLLRAVE
jgi:hypothetical protein